MELEAWQVCHLIFEIFKKCTCDRETFVAFNGSNLLLNICGWPKLNHPPLFNLVFKIFSAVVNNLCWWARPQHFYIIYRSSLEIAQCMSQHNCVYVWARGPTWGLSACAELNRVQPLFKVTLTLLPGSQALSLAYFGSTSLIVGRITTWQIILWFDMVSWYEKLEAFTSVTRLLLQEMSM